MSVTGNRTQYKSQVRNAFNEVVEYLDEFEYSGADIYLGTEDDIGLLIRKSNDPSMEVWVGNQTSGNEETVYLRLADIRRFLSYLLIFYRHVTVVTLKENWNIRGPNDMRHDFERWSTELGNNRENIYELIVEKLHSYSDTNSASFSKKKGRKPKSKSRKPKSKSRKPKSKSRKPKSKSRKPKSKSRKPRKSKSRKPRKSRSPKRCKWGRKTSCKRRPGPKRSRSLAVRRRS
jgi:hypothetical protein